MPQRTNRPRIGWNSNMVPEQSVPNGSASATHPCLTQYAIVPASAMVVGIGVPSKYFAFPFLSFGTLSTETLKRARRVRPQRTKKMRMRWSSGVLKPMAKAAAAGERPKEICGIVSLYFSLICLAFLQDGALNIPNQPTNPAPVPSNCSSSSFSQPHHRVHQRRIPMG